MQEQNNTAFSLSAEELQFCIAALQFEIEEIEQIMQDRSVTDEKREEFSAYIEKLDAIQDEFLKENNSFRSIDLLEVYQLVKQERDHMNDLLDDADDVPLTLRQTGQDHLRTANSVMRKLKNYFKTFDIEV